MDYRQPSDVSTHMEQSSPMYYIANNQYGRSTFYPRLYELTFDRASNHQNIGGGFDRFAWEGNHIEPNEFLVVRIYSGGMYVVNAGYGVAEYAPIYSMESFPLRPDIWHMTIHNPTPLNRQIGFYLIAKLPRDPDIPIR
ncbi:hypothetical protein IAQ67_15795 [Paenibacillus peoriae]|uniref:Uncharacterized protein n=1 Tax=Paenibacillus peoriae TaxID=59893 RepID=A0A7H0Y2P9_9BACL|nr:hypothetical protein [Paenibacillus peoriae]QNR65357.1 hypothetical protein IAQ67_15795 [Paenibacillus peoriae]